jgi:chemotaxis protein MotB
MGMRKKKGGHGGGHGWFVTFADLMGLLMSFFVVVAAFSTQDKGRMAEVAGSMREAFGVQPERRVAGIVELGGVPVREHARDVTRARQPEEGSVERQEDSNPRTRSREASSAAATLRQSLQEMPEVAFVSNSVIVSETPKGLAINIVDADGRAMFPPGSRFPFERTRVALQALAPLIARLGNQVIVSGHVPSSDRSGIRPGYTIWDLSSDRANSVRQILTESGLPQSRISAVIGRGDTQPVIEGYASSTANSRVTITLVPTAPVLPPSLRL